jgi:hypothetical protein
VKKLEIFGELQIFEWPAILEGDGRPWEADFLSIGVPQIRLPLSATVGCQHGAAAAWPFSRRSRGFHANAQSDLGHVKAQKIS